MNKTLHVVPNEDDSNRFDVVEVIHAGTNAAEIVKTHYSSLPSWTAAMDALEYLANYSFYKL